MIQTLGNSITVFHTCLKIDLRTQLETAIKWIKPYKLMCYVLIDSILHQNKIYT